ncbi:MAG TPA: tetratricopeptide repeat protein, partial [Treponemataceae bacterium]|nr:tetratricopeptide repeat protein [Treponemataceae bacterium]
MGIWKWMTKRNIARAPGLSALRGKTLPALVLVCLIPASSISADPSFGFRFGPQYAIPLGDTVLQSGIGGSIAADFLPFPFFGILAEGEYLNLGMKNVTGLHLFGGSLGLEGVWRFHDRMSVQAELLGGVYSVSGPTVELSGISLGARVMGSFYLSPAVTVSAHAGYKSYLYRPEPFLNAISVGASLGINLNEAFGGAARVSIETERQDPVFPVFYSWYDDNYFALVKVTNNEKTAITDVNASFYLEQYMGQPKLCATSRVLKPGESCTVPVKAFFNESMLELTERVDAEARMIVEYRVLGAKKRAELPIVIPVYHRNAMSWDDDRRAAAFVSSKDPAALWFSKYVSSIVSERERPGVNRNVQKAIGLFESLKTYGINYVVDPSSAYADNVGVGSSIDFLQYPYQTLMYRGGDCDDLSILYCSLFEAIGIKSAFITVPGHIYVAFDSGMTEEEAKRDFYAPGQLAYYEGKAWVPLEITLTKENFNKAWRIGAKEWSDSASRGTARIYPVEEAWQAYKPVSVPGAAARFNLPDEVESIAMFDSSLDAYIERAIRPEIRAYKALLARSDRPDVRNRLGVLYGKYGMLQKAKEQFIIAARADNVDAWVNLGNIAFMEQNYPEAIGYYNFVLSKHPEESVAILGAARAYYELEEFEYSDALYATLGTCDAGLERKYSYLGSFFDSTGRAWSLSERLSTTAWSLPEEKTAVDLSAYRAITDSGTDGVPPPAVMSQSNKQPTLPDLPEGYSDEDGNSPMIVPEPSLNVKKESDDESLEGDSSGDDS